MTRKEKILAVLKSFEQNIAYDEGGITLACITRPLYERLAEVIIDQALDLDVPSEEVIDKIAYDYCMLEGGDEVDPEAYRHLRDGMNMMKQEIIRRNKQ